MTDSIPISHCMSPCPYFVEQDQPMAAAHAIMRTHAIRHLPVCEHGKLVGLVSAGDLHLVETLDGVNPDEVTVREAMTPHPYQVRPNASLRDVVQTMAHHKYGCAIVTQGKELVGIFTTVDALNAFATVLGPG
jgi:acetoin utilization protein AcuB